MEVRSVFIYANDWYDKTGGNSYFSAEVWVNGRWLFTIPFSYGYGDYFVQAAASRLRSFGVLKIDRYESLHHYCLDRNIDLYTAKRSMRKNELAKKEMANIEFLEQLLGEKE